ncbi:MAG: hypothetical protein OXE79_06655 [Acidimicrobiaceae bacterium]|nr:hypothetical protein [Acidimicrobiaceae bacterium]
MALTGLTVLGAVYAQHDSASPSLGAQPAWAHPGPPGHSHRTPTTTAKPRCYSRYSCYRATTTTKRPRCYNPYSCYRITTTTKRPRRPPATTTKRPRCYNPYSCYRITTTTKRPRRPPATTTKRPRCYSRYSCYRATTTTKRPRRPPATTTTKRPATTTTKRQQATRRPATTTTRRRPSSTIPQPRRRPVTTTTRRPATTTTTQTGCRGWACGHVDSGVSKGYLPESFDHDRDTNIEDLRRIIEAYGSHNSDFDTDAAIEALKNSESVEVDRGDMFNVIAAGLSITYDPDDPFKVASELADRGILKGHDRDGDGISNPYIRPDADPDSTMTNEQLAAFLDRITPEGTDNGPRPPTTRPPDQPGDPGKPGKPGKPADPDKPGKPGKSGKPSRPGEPGKPDTKNPPDPADPDSSNPGAPKLPADKACGSGLTLDGNRRNGLLSRLQWATLANLGTRGEPGRPWPPHRDVPGGGAYLHLSASPMWPVVSAQGGWNVVGNDGCGWRVVSFEARLTQLLAWNSTHYAAMRRADSLRPDAGFGIYLQIWDNLSAAEKAQAQRNHVNHDVSAPSCPIAKATVSADSYVDCRWELATPGIWRWQAGVCFEAVSGGQTFRDCETLAEGVEWFLEIIDYTSGFTLQPPGGALLNEPRPRLLAAGAPEPEPGHESPSGHETESVAGSEAGSGSE